MKIAVISTEFLKDYVASYYDSLSLDCEFSYFIYKDFNHAGELYLQLEEEYDGFLVSGPVPRAAICRRVSVLNKPLVSFGSNALCYYETFFQVQFKEQDFYLEHGYFDLLEWYADPDARPLYDYLKCGEFNQLIHEVYKSTAAYTLEQLCAMEEKIKSKHIRLWAEGKISYSVTRFSNIMPDLLKAGVKTYFVYPKYEILHESATALLQEIHLKTMLQNQSAIAALNQQFSDNASVVSSHFTRQKAGSADQKNKMEQLSQKTGLSSSYVRRLLASLTTLDNDHITSQMLSVSLDITPRSANRLLNRLQDAGVAELLEEQHTVGRGRPEKIYRIHLS